MPLATTTPSAPLSPLIKMEDRKRPLGSAEEMAPPSKRQAINGGSKSSKDELTDKKIETDESWVEDYTKDAIYRQMQEYKRTCATLEARLQELDKRCAHHDDHIRIIDAWWIQLLQEVQILAESTVPFQSSDDEPPFPTHVTFRDIQDLELHLADKALSIKKLADSIFARLAASRGSVEPDVSSLEAQVNSVLAGQKDLLIKVARLTSEKDGLSEQLNTATLRYMKAERKLDRFRSTQVQKLEQQALAIATRPPNEQENGDQSEANGDSAELRLALQETQAVSQIQKEQLEAALTDAKSLQEQLTAAKAKLTSLSDEDYTHTEVFKLAKTRVDDLTRRFNHLEADNKMLQAKVGDLNGHREAYKQKLESEAQILTGELEEQLQQSDTNLARVRTARDELLADVTGLKASKDQERGAVDAMKELVSAKEDRISALELELQRLQPSEEAEANAHTDVDGLPLEELREKYKKLEQDFASINKELPAVVSGMKKFQAVANKKVTDLSALEDRLAMAVAEKTKADQKYFGVRKFDDTRAEELKRLRTQNAKSSEIISQLKENEGQSRTLVSNLEKQLVDLKQTNIAVASESKRLETTASETLRRCEGFKLQITELNNLAKSKDDFTAVAKDRAMAVEKEVAQLKTKLEHTSNERDKYKLKSLGNSSEEEDMLRMLVTCTVCRDRFKDTVLKTCGHVFCKQCIDDRLGNRMRKCPNCSRAFDKVDVMAIHL